MTDEVQTVPKDVHGDEVRGLVARGKEKGWLTADEIADALGALDLSAEQVDNVYALVAEEGIEVVDHEPGADTDEVEDFRRDPDLLKAPTNDPVRMYLKEIGKVPLLTAAQEVDLAMRIEGGEFSSPLLQSIDGNGKVDQKQFRRIVDSVVRIREHQLDPEKRLRHEGVGREKVGRAYRPKTRPATIDFLKRAGRDGQLGKKKVIEANPPVVGLTGTPEEGSASV